VLVPGDVLWRAGTVLVGNGVLDIEESRTLHPAYSGKKRPAEVIFANFIKCFDTNGDGQISRQEFIDYSREQNPSIPNDQHFEALTRNTWNLPAKKA
jgi:Ca2+-binding EF-hand superfamily protein